MRAEKIEREKEKLTNQETEIKQRQSCEITSGTVQRAS